MAVYRALSKPNFDSTRTTQMIGMLHPSNTGFRSDWNRVNTIKSINTCFRILQGDLSLLKATGPP